MKAQRQEREVRVKIQSRCDDRAVLQCLGLVRPTTALQDDAGRPLGWVFTTPTEVSILFRTPELRRWTLDLVELVEAVGSQLEGGRLNNQTPRGAGQRDSRAGSYSSARRRRTPRHVLAAVCREVLVVPIVVGMVAALAIAACLVGPLHGAWRLLRGVRRRATTH